VILGSEKYIRPFTVDDINRLSLPVVPHSPLWKNSWMNGDYGYYLGTPEKATSTAAQLVSATEAR
jgi:hypothetical protein